MKWKKLSTISAWTCGITAIIHSFFRRYIENYISIIVIIESLTVVIFLISEFMKLIIKHQSKNKIKG